MVTPTLADYVDLLFTLVERFWQHHAARPHRGHPFVYEHKALIVFFFMMQQRRLFRCKAQRRWLQRHCEMLKVFGLDTGPHRTTLSRRYKTLYAVLHDFIAFLGHDAEDLDPRFTSEDLYKLRQHILYLCAKLSRPSVVWNHSTRYAPTRRATIAA